MKIKFSDLDKNNYLIEDKLTHSEQKQFLSGKLKVNKKWFFYAYVVITLTPIPITSFTITKNLAQNNLNIVDCSTFVVLGIIISILFISIHELIRYVAYKITGARSVSFIVNFKNFYFATIANKFVTNPNEFTLIAILPFSVVLIGSLISIPFLDVKLQLIVLIFLLIHGILCNGDITLLNYMASNKKMVTYDDKEKGETYFYKQLYDQ